MQPMVVYDRTASGVLHVISLLPGDVTPPAGEQSFYRGASADGATVAFETQAQTEPGPLYLRIDDDATQQFAPAGAAFDGLSTDGRYAFYDLGGDIFRYDAATETTEEVVNTTISTVVNVAPSGEAVYFASPSDLAEGRPNPNGALPQAGGENLYVWNEGAISFVATVTAGDVAGVPVSMSNFPYGGLGLWKMSFVLGAAIDPSRTNASGSAFLFESRARLTNYDSQDHAEIYRFDAEASTLTCVSCSPTELSAESDASLLSLTPDLFSPIPTSPYSEVPNLSEDGSRALFQTADALVSADTDGVQDVYEWEAQGVGSCGSAAGCIYLISSGASAKDNYLYGVSADGDDVFFTTTDRLIERDAEGTPSIYDARVDGGFAEATVEGCEGEGCRPSLSPTPPEAARVGGPSGNVRPHPCAKGKHKTRRKGKVVCVKKHHRTKHHKKHRHHKGHRSSSANGRSGR